jgi:hypothetical protein
MALYSVTAARYDSELELQALQGYETNGLTRAVSPTPTVFTVKEVLAQIAKGDSFDLAFRERDRGNMVTAGLIVPDGRGSLTEEREEPGRRISDLPPF